MQKISSYLYPNRILLTTDLAVHPTEYRIVYQRKFKIYKGLDNELLLDIKNADQKRIDVSNKTIKVVIMDELWALGARGILVTDIHACRL